MLTNTKPFYHSKSSESQVNHEPMDEFNFRRSHVPAFGSWDCNNDMPFTQCFESATQAGLFRYSYSEDRDLYVAGDLYENDVVTPAMIVVPRHRGKAGYTEEKERKKDGWVVCDCDSEMKAATSPVSLSTPPYIHAPKAVDDDLYKISPDLVRANGKRVEERTEFLCKMPASGLSLLSRGLSS
ncbi:hypothetical protein PHJA_002158400 [Phtheirospermum japonicum]|uniref:RIN4 pathogenic type III effector avirulence factor Avr cleavage site domain-containing protein n=1 Tax=Phtheirospermum japonicum TaxID=374723 RepID=A0A830CWC0_9LAMI|nr:hypothetical protein PHJA_002158400 [Phtheirospermum japonicum]